MKTILQSEAAECGLACLAMIADKHGYKSDLNSLRHKYPQTLKGINLEQLIGIADELKLASRALKIDLEHLPQLQLPCILHWDLNHFVVLKSVTKSGIEILDPAFGHRKLTLEETSRHFTGIALELTPTEDFRKEDNRLEMKLSQFLSSVGGLKSVLFQLLLLSLVLQVFALAAPYYMQLVLDEVIISQDSSLLLVLALGFGMVTLFNVATTALRGFVVIHLGASLNKQLAFNLFRHLIRLPLDYFSNRHIGDVVSRFSSLEQVKQMLTNAMVEAVIDGVMAIATFIMIYLYSPKLALVVTVAMVLYLTIRLLWYRPLRSLTEEAIMASARENTNFMENVRGIQTIKLFGIEAKRQGLWQNHFTEALNLNVKVERLNVGYSIANSLLFGLENILVIYLGATLIMESTQADIFTVGMLTAFLAYKSQLTERFASLVDKIIEFKMLGLHLNRLADIAMTKQEENLVAEREHQITGSMQLDKISFRYASNEPWLFRELSFDFKQGESIAILGPSGCGKTTLMKIMLGLYKTEEGEVQVDGHSIKLLGQRQYRSQIATVMQSDELLSGSIADNISQFDPQIDIERVMECASMASIHDDIVSMPMSYNSLVGDMGATLSGGQKQRVLLARALYRNPKILFLDEATSHLDIASEYKVNQAIKTLNITRIIIAHRPETIKMADRVLELQNGQLKEVSDKYLN